MLRIRISVILVVISIQNIFGQVKYFNTRGEVIGYKTYNQNLYLVCRRGKGDLWLYSLDRELRVDDSVEIRSSDYVNYYGFNIGNGEGSELVLGFRGSLWIGGRKEISSERGRVLVIKLEGLAFKGGYVLPGIGVNGVKEVLRGDSVYYVVLDVGVEEIGNDGEIRRKEATGDIEWIYKGGVEVCKYGGGMGYRIRRGSEELVLEDRDGIEVRGIVRSRGCYLIGIGFKGRLVLADSIDLESAGGWDNLLISLDSNFRVLSYLQQGTSGNDYIYSLGGEGGIYYSLMGYKGDSIMRYEFEVLNKDLRGLVVRRGRLNRKEVGLELIGDRQYHIIEYRDRFYIDGIMVGGSGENTVVIEGGEGRGKEMYFNGEKLGEEVGGLDFIVVHRSYIRGVSARREAIGGEGQRLNVYIYPVSSYESEREVHILGVYKRGEIIVYDIRGRELYRSVISGGTNKILLPSGYRGIFIVKVCLGDRDKIVKGIKY